MKITGTQYSIIKDGMAKVIAYVGHEAVQKRLDSGISLELAMWDLFWAVYFDIKFDDTHPTYLKGRVRIVNHDATYDKYANGANDNHWNSALKKMMREFEFKVIHEQP